jgi:DNA-binding LacI/PurR family transcriptional regulator
MPERPSRPRLADVAAEAGVSTASASLVLRGKPGPGAQTRRAVAEAASRLGYRADRTASLLARRRTQLLGVTMDVRNPFHAELLEDIQEAAETYGYDVVVSPVTRARDEHRAVEALLDYRSEGLLLLGPSLPEADLEALAHDRAVVVIGRRVRAAGVDVVRAADDEGVGLAVAHLAGMGHREIAFLDGRRGPIATLRRQGFRSSMRRLVGPESPMVLAAGDTEEAGEAAAGALLAERVPTALVAFNDRCALGALDRLRREGVAVPGEVSVVGYDDSPLARLGMVGLTTVSQDPRTMAAAAVRAAVDRLEGESTPPVEVVLAPTLVVRTSTGPVRPRPAGGAPSRGV